MKAARRPDGIQFHSLFRRFSASIGRSNGPHASLTWINKKMATSPINVDNGAEDFLRQQNSVLPGINFFVLKFNAEVPLVP